MGANPNDYVVIFNLSRAGYTAWWFSALGLVLIGFGIATFLDGERKLRGAAFAIFSLFWTIITATTTYSEYRRLDESLQSAGAQIVEGPVENFVPDNWTSHKSEKFSVGNVEFSISPALVSNAFRHTVATGGPDLTGACVRILYVHDYDENKIVWLGLRRSNCPDT